MHEMKNRRYLFIALLAAAAACHSPTSPNDELVQLPQGHLSGLVTIGPNCPGAAECPTSPAAYSARKILVYNEAKSELLHTVDIGSQGAYTIDLAPGKYTVDLKPAGVDKTRDLPKTVDIQSNAVTTLNVNIDTGLR